LPAKSLSRRAYNNSEVFKDISIPCVLGVSLNDYFPESGLTTQIMIDRFSDQNSNSGNSNGTAIDLFDNSSRFSSDLIVEPWKPYFHSTNPP
jgi:hypothetical protein